MKAYVGLGSNLGEREVLLRAALEQLAQLPETRLGRVSSLYDTAPVGELDQPNFLNALAQLETALTARQLLWNLLLVERRLGRVRHVAQRYGPRTIDLDLVLFGDQVIDTPDLKLPHPEYHRRASCSCRWPRSSRSSCTLCSASPPRSCSRASRSARPCAA
jgi:2-amino-4-hydroxy-6-hydroxymethyldihydropteridine diphosphokinase